MNRVLLGVRGMERPDQVEKVSKALQRLEGVGEVRPAEVGQLEVAYDPQRLTVMDLIRAVREQGFLAGML
ncbi:MAG: heavy-metal-associated domain-containing protein [Meiothermus sp.]|uniref:heavy-metal-associated domain-containing protein n=1 Tax=Meiothermus sp. TaxID=1955249 RepID=UPI0025D56146|nr:heavy-metal-associated domain-containing protein [Meiothermus sp.]MCS7057646.1 heavy-metal-associated domain-containing protein [Meiothermus sp.]MCS7193998.1 heavy-metal-associated domain-containing protein [Meiothermus sp.]MCX7740909.1 heavy-metal-associated domain-containing protein [Meiothermus sp.]MDW8090715.1 heavy-metal-associated domain-containing protein [Meiothermus sp.]MDW8480858.1 heavy-metal-associated domain-containing protein [Meiothermus sp.]